MKKVLLSTVVALVFAAPAQACGLKCLNKKVNTLQLQLKATNQALIDLTNCLSDFPVTEYGDSTNGYVYSGVTGPFNTDALSVTVPGDAVGAWVLVDECNTQVTAAGDVPHINKMVTPILTFTAGF